ncbi:MAG TPA: hypothetical protein VMV79_05695 [Alphaproteobacteria bacterium]|nr:hypothetical protein [Alphaproteobacteria bacterium]
MSYTIREHWRREKSWICLNFATTAAFAIASYRNPAFLAGTAYLLLFSVSDLISPTYD